MEQTKNYKLPIVPIVTMFFLFAMISFVTNLAAPIGTIWKNEYAGANTLGMMGNMMNFLAYLFMGIPAGRMLVRIGYKKTALIAMAVGAAGLFVQYLSSIVGADVAVCDMGEGISLKLDFVIYLLGAFICGFCVCMLNTVVNPMLNLLGGGGNKGNQLLQTGAALNSLSGTLTPLFVGALIGTVTARTAMSDVTCLALRHRKSCCGVRSTPKTARISAETVFRCDGKSPSASRSLSASTFAGILPNTLR